MILLRRACVIVPVAFVTSGCTDGGQQEDTAGRTETAVEAPPVAAIPTRNGYFGDLHSPTWYEPAAGAVS